MDELSSTAPKYRAPQVRLTHFTAYILISFMRDNVGEFDGLTAKEVAALAIKQEPSLPRGLSAISVTELAKKVGITWAGPPQRLKRPDLEAKLAALESRLLDLEVELWESKRLAKEEQT